MNKLSSCQLFDFVNASFKGSIVKTIHNISDNIGKYTVESDKYDFMVKAMRSYKYPLSRLIVKSALDFEIRPMLLIEPKDLKDPQIPLPSAIGAISTSNGSMGFVDVSPRAKYVRDERGNILALKIKEIELYAYLQVAFIDTYLKKYSDIVDKSSSLAKNTAMAYSRLFSRCIDKTFPISANADRYAVSIFLSAVYCLVQFFGRSIEDAKNIVFSSGISNRVEIESDCRVLNDDKLKFTNLTEFLDVYAYEFSDYIKEGTLTLRLIVNLFVKMYGANSYFALEHGATFLNMILSVPIGLYNDKFIAKTIKAQVDKINEVLVTTFANPR